MRCDDVALVLSESVDDPSSVSRSASRHIERCLRCQAEQAQYRKVRRAMLRLADSVVDPGVDFVSEVMAGIKLEAASGQYRGDSDRRKVVYLAAATAATAATAAGAIVLASRSRRPAS